MSNYIHNLYKDRLVRSPLKTAALIMGAVVVAPAVASLLKPVAKASIKAGVLMYEKGKGAVAEAGEQVGDLIAEAQAEILAEQAAEQELPVVEVQAKVSQGV